MIDAMAFTHGGKWGVGIAGRGHLGGGIEFFI